MPFPPLRLALGDERRLLELCRRALPSRFTAAAEIGRITDLPTRRRLESTWIRSLHFVTEGAAQAWNEGWSRVAADPDFAFPLLLTMNGAPFSDPAAEFVAHIASRVMHEEIRAGTPVLRVAAGWEVEQVLSHLYETMPSPWTSSSLMFTTTWSVLDERGDLLWCVDCAREYEVRLLPPNAAQLLTAKPRFDTVEVIGSS